MSEEAQAGVQPEKRYTIRNGPINASPEIGELAGAMAKAQADVQKAHTDNDNPFFKSKYADLASVWDACREALSANGLAVIQTLDESQDGRPVIVTIMTHSSGQWINSHLTIKPVKPDPQALGSAITYARRYALAAIAGVAPTDDDGNEASDPGSKSKAKVEVSVRESRDGGSSSAHDDNRPSHGSPDSPVSVKNPDDEPSEKQRRMIGAVASGLELTDDQRHEILDELFGISSSKDLTKGRASTLIDHLKTMEAAAKSQGDLY